MPFLRLRIGTALLSLAAVLIVSSEAEAWQRQPDARPAVPARPAAKEGEKTNYPEMKVDITIKGTSSRQAWQDARNRLPMNLLSETKQARVNAVLARNSLFRRLPQIDFDAEPEVYSWFTQNPEVAVSTWRVLKISEFKLKPAGNNVWLGEAQDGSKGTIEILHRTANSQLLLCEGEYKTPLLTRPIRASAVMHLQTQFTRKPNGEGHVTHGVDLFVAFPSQTVDTVAKVISPVSNMIADRNFKELSLFVRFMSIAMQKQPGWVEQLSTRLDDITPKQKDELLNMSARIFIASRKRALKNDGVRQATLEQIVAPYKQPSGR
ncbi:MAG: hypothetical protein H8E37_01530 [Planctomycetes bacterium]|nr:hypothetical protein [Planctomycetota bacterium]